MNNIKKKSGVVKSLAALTIACFLVASMLASCGGDKDESSANSSSSAISSEAESSVADSSVSTESGVDSSYAVSDSGDSSLVSDDVDESSADESSVDESSDESSSPDEESSTSEEPEVLGTGTKADPYLMIPDENRTVTTYEIPAGESQFYAIYRVGGTILTVESENISIEYDGFPYVAKKGKLSLTVGEALASDAILFEVINEGDAAEIFVLQFANPLGTMANPEVLEDIDVENITNIKKDSATGYFYTYKVESDAEITFYFESETDCSMTVNCIRDEIPTQYTSDEDPKVDEKGRSYFTIPVKAGDELVINLSSKPVGAKYPAAEIIWTAEIA